MFNKQKCHGCKKPQKGIEGFYMMRKLWWGKIKTVWLCIDCSTSPDHYDSAVERITQ